MPKLRKLANRTHELEMFLKMAAGQHDCRIMLIEGESGMGKSSLLNRFKQECPKDIQYVPFDCKGLSNIASFLSEVMLDLKPERFSAFERKLRLFVQGGVDFSGNDIAAKEQINIAINSDIDAQTQQYRLEQLQTAFFEDLSKLDGTTIVTLDTYQEASPQLRDWVESKWLRAVERHLTNVVTVVAGQSIPDPNNSVWGSECEHFELKAIHDVKAWCEFCEELPEDAIKTITLAAKGHPSSFSQMLEIVKPGW